MDPTLRKQRGQALIETVLMLPLWLLAFWAFAQLHRVALEDFENTRQIRELLADREFQKNLQKLHDLEKASKLKIQITQKWPSPPPPRKNTSSNLPFSQKLPALDKIPGKLMSLIVKPQTMTCIKDREGLWPDRELQVTTLTPGELRERGHWIALSLSGLGLLK